MRKSGYPPRKILFFSKSPPNPSADPRGNCGAHDPDAVDAHVHDGRAALRHEILVELVTAGKSHAKQGGGHKKGGAPPPVNVQRKQDGQRQHEIFRHVRRLAQRHFDGTCMAVKFCLVHFQMKQFIAGFHDLVTDVIAQTPRSLARLRRKAENDRQHEQGG